MDLIPRTRRSRALAAAGAVGALAVGALVAIPASSAMAATGCAVAYTATSWPGGFTASITIKNVGDPISDWTLGFTFPNGQKYVQGWSATYSQSGSAVTARSMGYNGALGTGASTNIGFNGSWSGSNTAPTSFTLNGATCTGSTTPDPTTPPPNSPTPPPNSPSPSPSPIPPSPPSNDGTPVGINGQLRVCGVNLCNQYGKAIQLRGMSTHGLQWFAKCHNNTAFDVLAKEWKADLLRISMYVQEEGYETNPAAFTAEVNRLVDMAEARGMYALIDFHTLTPGDPNYNLERAKTFFASVAARNANKKNVIYEITNEPNGVSWQQIKNYANQVIPVVRGADSDSIIIVGTRAWSSLGVSEGGNESEVVNSPINAPNIMYTFHFYAASHLDNYRQALQRAAARLPMFVTEFGMVTYTGSGNMDTASTNAWLNMLDQLKISYAYWNYSDAAESGAAFKPGTCNGGTYGGTGVLNPTGVYMRNRIMTPDNFPTS